MIAGIIQWFGQQMIMACDAQCQKAWGINNRPTNKLSTLDGDFEWLADYELETAPIDPGTYEGSDAKPTDDGSRLNRWCARECERSVIVAPGADFDLPAFDCDRVSNM